MGSDSPRIFLLDNGTHAINFCSSPPSSRFPPKRLFVSLRPRRTSLNCPPPVPLRIERGQCNFCFDFPLRCQLLIPTFVRDPRQSRLDGSSNDPCDAPLVYSSLLYVLEFSIHSSSLGTPVVHPFLFVLNLLLLGQPLTSLLVSPDLRFLQCVFFPSSSSLFPRPFSEGSADVFFAKCPFPFVSQFRQERVLIMLRLKLGSPMESLFREIAMVPVPPILPPLFLL